MQANFTILDNNFEEQASNPVGIEWYWKHLQQIWAENYLRKDYSQCKSVQWNTVNKKYKKFKTLAVINVIKWNLIAIDSYSQLKKRFTKINSFSFNFLNST